LFHWLSTNNQLSLLFVVNQRIFVHRCVAGLVADSETMRRGITWHRFLTRCWVLKVRTRTSDLLSELVVGAGIRAARRAAWQLF